MELSKSDIVKSTAGSTKGRLFHVLDVENGYALIADGKRHKLTKPKRKKLKHLEFVAESNSEAARGIREGGEVQDSALRRSLAAYRNQGGF